MCDTCNRTGRQFFGTYIGEAVFKFLLKKGDEMLGAISALVQLSERFLEQ